MATLHPLLALALLALALLAAGPALAAADPPGDPAAGDAFAAGLCAACHELPGGPAPYTEPGGAPPFREIADDPAATADTLRAFLQGPHPTMPDFILSPEQVDDLVAYILSLRPGRE